MGGALDWLEFSSTVIGHVFSWPVAVVLSVMILRRSLGRLLGRLSKLSGPGEIQAEFTLSELIVEAGAAPAAKGNEHAPGSGGVRPPGGGGPAERRPAGGIGGAQALDSTTLLHTLESRGADGPPNYHLFDPSSGAKIVESAALNAVGKRIIDNHDELQRMAAKRPNEAVVVGWDRFKINLHEIAVLVGADNGARTWTDELKNLLKYGFIDSWSIEQILSLRNIREAVSGSDKEALVSVDRKGASDFNATLFDKLITLTLTIGPVRRSGDDVSRQDDAVSP